MLIRGQTTEERIGEIASKFAKGIDGVTSGMKMATDANNQSKQQELIREREARQRAIQELDVETKLSEQTGRDVIGSGLGAKIMKGEVNSLDFGAFPLSRKAQMDEQDRKIKGEDRLLDNDYKKSQINKNNAAASGPSGMGKASVAEQSVDRSFAKTYDDFIVGGGYTKTDRGLKALKEVSASLGAKGSDLTGPVTGRVPDFVQSFTNPKALETREMVGTIIQDNLKAILGSAYTEAEGERVIRRAYDPTLSEAANKTRLDAMVNQMEGAARAKLEASKYFEANGTMRGFKGVQINSVDDVFSSSKEGATSAKPWEKYKK